MEVSGSISVLVLLIILLWITNFGHEKLLKSNISQDPFLLNKF